MTKIRQTYNNRKKYNFKFLIILLTLSYISLFGKNNVNSIKKNVILSVDSTANGFVGDGVTDNTKAIQAAIDSVYNTGGGVIEFSNGKFLTGPFILRSNIMLQIDSSATILATQNQKAFYYPNTDTSLPPTSLQNFIYASNAQNITITGGGTIDGQGQPWWDAFRAASANGQTFLRPRLIELEHITHLLVTNITLKNSPMFHLCPQYSYDVNINHITILAPSNSPNTDGIDPAQCHHVRISYCKIDNGDDNIAVGASHSDPSWTGAAANTDIIISHCTFFHGHGCSIGSYTNGGVDSMLVDSCTFNGTDNGFRIKSNRGRGGDIRGITYSNVTMTNVKYPIYFSEYYPSIPAQTDPAQTVNSTTPHYHDITIKNLTATGSPYAGVIVGVPEMPITNIHLQNVTISASKGLQIRNASVDTTNTSVLATSGSSYILEVNGMVSGATLVNDVFTPKKFSLEQNYPNPFNPSTAIRFSIEKESHVKLDIFNALGQRVVTLIDQNMNAGNHEYNFNASELSSGVYFYRIIAGGFIQTLKMILLR